VEHGGGQPERRRHDRLWTAWPRDETRKERVTVDDVDTTTTTTSTTGARPTPRLR